MQESLEDVKNQSKEAARVYHICQTLHNIADAHQKSTSPHNNHMDMGAEGAVHLGDWQGLDMQYPQNLFAPGSLSTEADMGFMPDYGSDEMAAFLGKWFVGGGSATDFLPYNVGDPNQMM